MRDKNGEYIDAALESSTREFMIYFMGLGNSENHETSAYDLVIEMPYSEDEILRDIDILEKEGYLKTNHSLPVNPENQILYPEKTKGFNDVLSNTDFGEIDEKPVKITSKAEEYIQRTNLDSLETSIKQVFNNYREN